VSALGYSLPTLTESGPEPDLPMSIASVYATLTAATQTGENLRNTSGWAIDAGAWVEVGSSTVTLRRVVYTVGPQRAPIRAGQSARYVVACTVDTRTGQATWSGAWQEYRAWGYTAGLTGDVIRDGGWQAQAPWSAGAVETPDLDAVIALRWDAIRRDFLPTLLGCPVKAVREAGIALMAELGAASGTKGGAVASRGMQVA
jgi:hypothetical protein